MRRSSLIFGARRGCALYEEVCREVCARLASMLLLLLESEGVVVPEGYKIPTRYTHQQIASMVGANREAVTRALGTLRQAEAVETRNRQIYVTDAAALEYF